MESPKDPTEEFEKTSLRLDGTDVRISVGEVLTDLRAGLRTVGFLNKYGLTMGQFEDLLKGLIRQGFFSKEEFKLWKARKLGPSTPAALRTEPDGMSSQEPYRPQNIATYVISEPEKNHSWALQLFSTDRDRMRGAKFKVSLQGKKYSFVVEEMLFRGAVGMLVDEVTTKSAAKEKREEAIDFISRHGWAAYLENRAITANLGGTDRGITKKARLVLLHCRNDTFLAALHTPAPAINLYVGTSLENILSRLSRSVDTSVIYI